MGRILEHQFAFSQSFIDQMDLTVYEVTHSAVYQLRCATRGGLSEIASFYQGGFISSGRGICRDTQAGGAATDDQNIKAVLRELREHLRPCLHEAPILACKRTKPPAGSS